ncbi:MAG: alpha/beta fold hydrolase [Opitutaceae bacterium]
MSETRFSVIYLLHGRGNSMEAWRTIAPDLDRMIEARQIPPVIAVMPDAPSSHRAGYYIDSRANDGRRVETAFTVDLVGHIDAAFRTRAERRGRIVCGYSMGGYGALRFGLAHSDLFGAAIVLSPAVYFPLPPRASSTREFGAFGRGSVRFDDAIYRAENYPALLPAFDAAKRRLAMFIAVGDREMAHADPAEAMHDLDYEAHTLYNRVRRVPGITARLRVLDGGHDWGVWRPAFVEGLIFSFGHLGTARD